MLSCDFALKRMREKNEQKSTGMPDIGPNVGRNITQGCQIWVKSGSKWSNEIDSDFDLVPHFSIVSII